MGADKSFVLDELKVPIHQWAGLHSELIWIYDGAVEASTRNLVSDHRSDYWMWLLRSGSVRVRMNRKTWQASAGQWILCPQGIMQQEFSRKARILSIHFRCAWPTGENLFADREALVFASRDFPRLERNATSLARMVRRRFPHVRHDLSLQAASYHTYLWFQFRFLQWLDDFASTLLRRERSFSRVGAADERTFQAARILHQMSLQAPFPAERLEHDIGLGRAQIDRLFWLGFGMTTRKYWDKLRENAAVRKLEASSLPLKEIGYSLGFKQPSHFTRWFGQRLGLSPGSFRARTTNRRYGRAKL